MQSAYILSDNPGRIHTGSPGIARPALSGLEAKELRCLERLPRVHVVTAVNRQAK